MKKLISNSLRIMMVCLLAGILVRPVVAMGASAGIEITSDANEVTVGSDVTIYINITADTAFGDLEANLIYDDDILEYQSDTSFITGSSGFLKISDMGLSEEGTSRKYALTFTALKTGSCTIAISGRAMVYEAESGLAMPVSAIGLELEVVPAYEASDNANLKALKISPSELSPEFDTDIYEYSASVGNDVEKLIINAVPEDNNAKITITGNESLKEGENKIVIKVLAESGAVIEYTIHVTKNQSTDNGEEQQEENDTATPANTTFEVIEEAGKIYADYSGRYELMEPGSEVSIPEGYVKTRLILAEISITAFAPEDDLDNNFLLIYARNKFGEEGFYQYDRVEKTLQRFNRLEVTEPGQVVVSGDDVSAKEYQSNMNKAVAVIALLCGLSAVLLIALIRMYMKARGYREDDLD